MISQQHLDDLAIEAVGNQLKFFERVRLGVVSGRFAHITYAERRRLKLLLVGSDQQEHSFRIAIIRHHMRSGDDFRPISDMDSLGRVLWAVFSRVAKWRSICLLQTSFNDNDQQIGLFDRLLAAMAHAGNTTMNVRIFKFIDGTVLSDLHRGPVMTRLSLWIEQCSPHLRHVLVDLHLVSQCTEEQLQPFVLAIAHCQQLRQLDVSGVYVLNWIALPPVLTQLPALNSIRLCPLFLDLVPSPRSFDRLPQIVWITDHWLATFAQGTFRPLLNRMKTLVLMLPFRHLPLSPAHLLAVNAVVASMMSPVRIVVSEHCQMAASALDWSGAASTLDLVLADWLPLAKDKNMAIILNTKRRHLLTVDQYLAAIVALPSALCKRLLPPTIASVRAGQRRLSFCYSGGGKVVVKCPAADLANNHSEYYSDNYYELDWLFGGGRHWGQKIRTAIEDHLSLADGYLLAVSKWLAILGLALLLIAGVLLLLSQ